MFFKSTPKGCTSEAKAQFGETILNGKTKNLTSLGMDVKEWQDIEIIVKNRKVSVRINQSEVLSTEYAESSGMLTGLGFLSNGLPEVKFVSLKNNRSFSSDARISALDSSNSCFAIRILFLLMACCIAPCSAAYISFAYARRTARSSGDISADAKMAVNKRRPRRIRRESCCICFLSAASREQYHSGIHKTWRAGSLRAGSVPH